MTQTPTHPTHSAPASTAAADADGAHVRQPHPAWGRALLLATLAAALIATLVVAFAWPASRAAGRDIRVAVVASPAQLEQLRHQAGPHLGAVELVPVADRDAAVRDIERRDVIGAVVLAGQPEVLKASAGGQVPSAIMDGVAAQAQVAADAQLYAAARQGAPNLPPAVPTVRVTDVVPLSEHDASGAGLVAAGIPLTVGAILCGALLATALRGRWQRLAALLAFAVLGGGALALVLGPWLHVLPRTNAITWLALALSLLATSGLFVGLHSVLGRLGLGLAGVTTLLAAMPWAAFAVPSAFLPGGLGGIGQAMIPGASATLLRDLAYFPDAAASRPWWVLVLWALAGLTLTALRRRTAERA